MLIQVRFEGEVAILSNIGRAMNNPRYVDAASEVADLLDSGTRGFVIEMRGAGEVGPPLLGLLMTLTRQIRREGGEVVLAGLGRGTVEYLSEMRMDDVWDVYRSVQEAQGHFKSRNDASES